MPPLPPSVSGTPGPTNVTLATGKIQNLYPGNYGALVNNGSIRLYPGAYSFSSIALGGGATLYGLWGGSITVSVSDSFTTGSSVVIGHQSQLAGDLSISVAGTDRSTAPAVSIGAGNQLNLILNAPHGTIAIGDNSGVRGALAGFSIVVGNNTTLMYDSGLPVRAGGRGKCASDADCAEGLVCGHRNGAFFGLPKTTDVCWSPSCNDDPFSACGTATSACGTVCACDRITPNAAAPDAFGDEVAGVLYEPKSFGVNAFVVRDGIDPGAAFTRYGKELGLRECVDTLEEDSTPRAAATPGQEIVTFQQYYKGAPVIGGGYVVHRAQGGGPVREVTGKVVPKLALDVTARVDRQTGREHRLHGRSSVSRRRPIIMNILGYAASLQYAVDVPVITAGNSTIATFNPNSVPSDPTVCV